MFNPKNIGIFALAVAVIALLGVYSLKNQDTTTLGGGIAGFAYPNATTTSTMTSVMNTLAGNRVVTLGSVNIASTSATTFTLWDASSTTDTGSTTVGTFKASIAEGLYNFDMEFKRGLIVELPSGYDGDAIITWKSQ